MPLEDIRATIVEDSSILTSETPLSEYQINIYEEHITITPFLVDTTFTSVIFVSQSDTAISASHALVADNAISSSYSLSGSYSNFAQSGSYSVSSSYSLNAQTYSSSFSSRLQTDETNITNLQTASGSLSTRVTDLESFSSSLDLTYATDAELVAATASLSSSLAVNIATNANNITNLQTASGSFSTRVTTLETQTDFSGSFSGSFQGNGANITGIVSSSYAVSSSRSENTLSSSYAVSSSFAQNSISASYSTTSLSASYATNVGNPGLWTSSLDGSLERSSNVRITGSLNVSNGIVGNLTGTSSYSNQALSASYAPMAAGSTQWTASGDFIRRQSDVEITGSLRISGAVTSSLLGTASYADYALSSSHASYAISASYAVSASYEIMHEVSSSHAVNADTASYVQNAQTASYVLSASYAPTISGSYSYNNLDGIPAGIVSSSNQINTGSFSGSFYGDGSGLNDIQLAQSASYFQTSSITPSASYAEFALSASYAPQIPSGSYSYSNLDGIPVGILSSSEQIASEISGSFTSFSSSAENRITDLETFSSSLDIVSSSYAISSSYSNYALAALSASYAPQTPSGSYSYSNLDGIPAGIVSSSLQINTGSFSGSFFGDGSNLNDIQLAQTASYFQTASITPSSSFSEYALTSSYVETSQTASYVLTALTASYFATASITPSASYVNTAETASYVVTALTSSYFATSSITPSASYVNTAETASYFATSSITPSASYVNTAETASYVVTSLTASYFATSSITPSASYAEFALSASYAPGGINYWTANGNIIYNNLTESIRIISHPSESHVMGATTLTTIDPAEYTTDSASNAAWSSSLNVTPSGYVGSGSDITSPSTTVVTSEYRGDWGAASQDNMIDNSFSTTLGTNHGQNPPTRWASESPAVYPVTVTLNNLEARVMNKFAHMPVTVNGGGTWAKNFAVSGSTDNATWVPLFASAAINITNQDYQNIWMTYTLPNNITPYQYYRISYYDTWDVGNDTVSINEMELFTFTSSVATGSLVASSEATFKTSGSYSVKIAADKNSLNATCTRTLTASLNLSNMSSIQFDARASRTGTNFELHMHDTGGAINSHSINIATSGSFQHETWNISPIANTNKDAIDYFLIKIIDASADNLIYIDGIWAYNSGSDTTVITQGKIELSGSLYLPSPDNSIWKVTLTDAGIFSASKQI